MRRPPTGHRGRVFYASLLSYLAILLIPVVMSFLVFNRASDTLTDEAAKANRKLLTQMGLRLDRILREVFQVYQLVSYNPRVKGLIYERGPISADDYYRAYEVVNDFGIYEVTSPTISSFYVYIPELDMVISESGYFTSSNYFGSWAARAVPSYGEWVDGFPKMGGIAFRQGRVELSNDTVTSTIAMYAPLPVGNQRSEPPAWCVIHVDQRAIDRILTSVEWTPESLLVIYDERDGILASSGAVSAEVLRACQEQLTATGAIDHLVVDGRRYLAFVQPSGIDEVKWSYISLVAADLYRDRFMSLSRFTIAAFLVCFIIGGAVIYWFASARYRPIHAMLSIIEPDSDGRISLRSDEFAIMRRSLQARLAEDAELRDELTRSQPVLMQRYLTQLMRGMTPFDSDAIGRLKRLGVELDGSFILMLVEVDGSEPRPRLASLVETHFTETRWDRLWIVEDIGGATGVLVRVVREDEPEIVRFASALREQIELATSVPCAVGLSSIHHVDVGLAVLYAEAESALGYRLVRGRTRPIRYADVQHTGRAYYYPLELEGRLMNTIQVGNYDDSASILNDIYSQNFEGSALSVEMARCLMFDLISTMIKTLNALEAASDDAAFWAQTKPVSRLSACRSLEQLVAEMDDILRNVCRHVVEHRKPRAKQLYDEIVCFVEANFADSNLSVDMVADHVGRNPAYISRFFREESNSGIATYLKRFRVEAAKELLLTSALTIREVAERVGFVTSNALIRAFKETEGVTPGEYRAGRGAPIPPATIAISTPSEMKVRK